MVSIRSSFVSFSYIVRLFVNTHLEKSHLSFERNKKIILNVILGLIQNAFVR